MWVIRDADSTIYLTGTIHLLPKGVDWRSEKLDSALKDATELWLELAELGDTQGFNAKLLATYEDDLKWDGPPWSESLSENERALLDAAVKEANTPPAMVELFDHMKPLYAVYAIGRMHDVGGAYREENGIDRALARLAVEQGDAIKGLETLEFQVADMFEMSAEDQLAELRWRLTNDLAIKDRAARVADVAYLAWTRGDTNLVEAMSALIRTSGVDDGLQLPERNAAWAEKIEQMLAGAGTSFIAVGAMHLVGTNSLQHYLKLRGIETERY